MITAEMYKSLGLNDEEYQKILKILGREPTITELAMFSVEWSEHCGYLCSKKWLRLLPKTGKYQTLVGEDAGGIFLDDLAIVFKMESHNHPSQIEPKQGAATGVGGIVRDILGTGVRPVAVLDSLRFGPLAEPYNKYLLKGVVDGIQSYGNCLGLPTVAGEIYFDESYSGNCLVNVMCIGVANKAQLSRSRTVGIGNSILYVGSSTGRDGIGGCSVLASEEFKEGEEKRPTVQIGDPFTEKCLIEAILEALASGDVVGMKDMGAAGLTCASSEMAAAGNTGIEIELDLVPKRETGMQPWEMMMSESQERFLLCVRKGKEEKIKKIFAKWDLHAVVVGAVTDDGMVRIKEEGKIVAEIKAQDLTTAPLLDMPDKKPAEQDELNKLDMASVPQPKDYNDVLLRLLGSASIASKQWVYEQYDHMVQTNTVVLPGSDAAVLRIKGTQQGIAATTDCNSLYCLLNPLRGAQIAVAEAARNLVCVGAEPVAVTDCLNFANPEKPERFWYFKNCVEGIAEACKFFGLPVVSGNVSFYNENPKGAVNPTPTIGMIGIVDDVSKVTKQYFCNAQDTIILLGENKGELGGCEYLKVIHGQRKGDAPQLDLKTEKAVQEACLEAIKRGLVNSCHDCSEGGLAVALAEACMSNKEKMLGATIDRLEANIRMDALLFGESQSRIVLSCAKESVDKIVEIAKRHKAPFQLIGRTGGKSLKILGLIDLPVAELHRYWSQSITEAVAR